MSISNLNSECKLLYLPGNYPFPVNVMLKGSVFATLQVTFLQPLCGIIETF